MANCRFEGKGAKCRRTDCPFYGMEHPGPSKRRCKYDSKQGGCWDKDCKFKHNPNPKSFQYYTISGPRDVMRTLIRNKGSLLNRIRRKCRAQVEVSISKEEISSRGTREEIEASKWATYHEMKLEGSDFLRLRDQIEDKSSLNISNSKDGLQSLRKDYGDTNSSNSSRIGEDAVDLRNCGALQKKRYRDVKQSLEIEAKNIEIQELKRKEKNLKEVIKKSNDKNKQLMQEKDDIKQEYDLKIDVLLKENENSEKLRMKKENSYNKLQIEVNSLKIKEERQSGDSNTNVENLLDEKDKEFQAVQEQRNEIENNLQEKCGDINKKEAIIQDLKGKETKMRTDLQDMEKDKNLHLKELKVLRKRILGVKKILQIRNRELKLYKDILGDSESGEDPNDDEMEKCKSIIKDEIQSGIDQMEETIDSLSVKEEVDVPEFPKPPNSEPFQIITIDD